MSCWGEPKPFRCRCCENRTTTSVGGKRKALLQHAHCRLRMMADIGIYRPIVCKHTLSPSPQSDILNIVWIGLFGHFNLSTTKCRCTALSASTEKTWVVCPIYWCKCLIGGVSIDSRWIEIYSRRGESKLFSVQCFQVIHPERVFVVFNEIRPHG